ncbi:hypothetical protein AB0F52_27740 [Amycolatopsis sp. NPDC024027]|uniref:hypothetical protein n=1 Tax=Amycolatopsis sp. NPDC024027 TaxID=3154327 RepID=UPI0033FDCEA2
MRGSPKGRWTLLLAGVPFAALMTLFAAGEASAATSCSSTTGSSVCYTTGEHHLEVCDTKGDGWSAYAWWNAGTSHSQPTNRAQFTGGSSHCGDFSVSGSGGKVSFQACRDVRHDPDNCGSWVTVTY